MSLCQHWTHEESETTDTGSVHNADAVAAAALQSKLAAIVNLARIIATVHLAFGRCRVEVKRGKMRRE